MHKDVKHRKNWVINLSKHKLTETETDVLSLGLNFAVTKKTLPKQNIIAEVEKGIRKLPNAQQILFVVRLSIPSINPIHTNLS